NQFNYHQRIQQSLIKKNDLMNKITGEQRKEFDNVRRIGSYEIQRAHHKKKQIEAEAKLSREQKEQAQREKQALSDMKSDLRTIHNLEMKIEEIKTRAEKSSRNLTQEERNRLEVLNKELSIAQRNKNETEGFHKSQKA